MENIHKQPKDGRTKSNLNQRAGVNTNDVSDERTSEQDIDMSSSHEEVDLELEIANAWRLESLIWCKCRHCFLSTKTIECFDK